MSYYSSNFPPSKEEQTKNEQDRLDRQIQAEKDIIALLQDIPKQYRNGAHSLAHSLGHSAGIHEVYHHLVEIVDKIFKQNK